MGRSNSVRLSGDLLGWQPQGAGTGGSVVVPVDLLRQHLETQGYFLIDERTKLVLDEMAAAPERELRREDGGGWSARVAAAELGRRLEETARKMRGE